jgi:hypothetical protein
LDRVTLLKFKLQDEQISYMCNLKFLGATVSLEKLFKLKLHDE